MEPLLYPYAKLIRMKKKDILRLAGYRNIKHALKDNINRKVTLIAGHPIFSYDKLTKKFIARIIASDR